MEGLLAPLLALAGHCFAGDFSPGTVDRHCFSAVYGGQHVRDIHVVTKDGRPVYEGETLYSVESDKLALTYWSSIGGIGRGTARLASGDWTFAMTMRATPAAEPQAFSTRWQWHGADSYTVTGGPAAVTYRRVSSAPTPTG
jgi:hypothetical protein